MHLLLPYPLHDLVFSKISLFFIPEKAFLNLLKRLIFSKNFLSTLEDILEKIKKKIVRNRSNLAKINSHAGRGANWTEHHNTLVSAAGGSPQKRNRKIHAFQS